MMVQKRQFRKTHIDEHYCTAVFRYLCKYGFLVAAAERGLELLCPYNKSSVLQIMISHNLV